jgi:hypothetical protein
MEIHYIIAIVFLLIVLLFVIYVVMSSIQQQRMLNVQSVTTGEVIYSAPLNSNPIVVEKIILFGKKFIAAGKTCNSADYLRVRAEGNSMKKRGISNGDIVFARKFDDSFTRSQIRPQDILLVHLNDERYKGYKIRVFRQYSPTNELETFYYNADGSERNSSQFHSLSRVVGVVQYKIESMQ